jgi:hypothetical protein
MSKTNEIIHNNIESQMSHINDLIRILNLNKFDQLKESVECINKIKEEYQPINLQYLNELTENLMMTSSPGKVQNETSIYYCMILSNNTISRLEIYSKKITIFVKEQMNLKHGQIQQVKGLLSKIDRIDLNIKIKKFDCDLCESCKEVTESKPINETHSKCVNCGLVKSNDSHSVDYDDDLDDIRSPNSASYKRPKRGTHEAEKHCTIWIDKITAIKETEVSEEQDRRIRKWFTINNIRNKKLLHCEDYRRCFKESHITELNDYVTYIRLLYSGISPPRISYDERQEIIALFILVVEVHEDIKTDESNLKYYPFFILKIVPGVIKDKARCVDIQMCIHLQSSVTLKSNDSLWKKITDTGRLPIEFVKTDCNPTYR